MIRFTEEVSTLLRSATSAPSTDTGGCTGATSPMATAVAPVAIDDEEVEEDGAEGSAFAASGTIVAPTLP
mgnify:CR=1 FL=1